MSGSNFVATIVAFFNQKGGTAKTTSTLNVGAALVERGRRVLALDLDPQASLTMALGVDVVSLEWSIYDSLSDPNQSISAVIRASTVPGMDLIPSHPDLAAAELELLNVLERERLSQWDLGRRVGASQPQVSRWIKGESRVPELVAHILSCSSCYAHFVQRSALQLPDP
jgi:cellulose biosynthesis protein BcsQ